MRFQKQVEAKEGGMMRPCTYDADYIRGTGVWDGANRSGWGLVLIDW